MEDSYSIKGNHRLEGDSQKSLGYWLQELDSTALADLNKTAHSPAPSLSSI